LRKPGIDGEIQFVPIPGFETTLGKPVTADTTEGPAFGKEPSANAAPQHHRVLSHDPTFRIGALDAANREVVTVKPDEPISLAITRMLAYDYSQLPVMTSPREVKGMISWSSVGSGMALRRDMASGNEASAIRHFMEKHYVLGADESFFEAVPIIVDRGYVLVRGIDNRITGIVTASDVSMEFKQRAEPFLLLSEIEQHVRNLIDSRIPLEELRKVRNPADDARTIERTSDLALGECVRVFQSGENWIRMNLGNLDRVEFVEKLDKIREIRNDVMHFYPDPLEAEELLTLHRFAKFLQRFRTIRDVV